MKVRDFQRLAELSEADGHLQQKLKQLLKLSKEKWDSACDHAKTAVQVARLFLHIFFLWQFLLTCFRGLRMCSLSLTAVIIPDVMSSSRIFWKQVSKVL